MIKPIKKSRSKSKNNNNIKTKNCSTPNLFEKVNNPINLNKEKPNKVYNNSTYLTKVNKKQLAKIAVRKNLYSNNYIMFFL